MTTPRIYKHGTAAMAASDAPDLSPGKFPIHALNPVMRAMVEEVANVHRVPVELPGMCAVAIVSGALVRPLIEASAKLEADFKQNEFAKLKTEKAILTRRVNVLVNELATGKTETDKGKTLMGEAEKRETTSELEEAHARLDAIEPFLQALPTYWIGNATSEAMEIQFKRNNVGLFCYSPEAAAPIRVMLGKYTKGESADLDLYLSGYSVEDWRSDRVGRGVCQIKPCLAMLLMVQPSILHELMGNEEAFERGMTARTLMFIAETEPLEDDGIIRQVAEQTAAAWSGLIKAILGHRESLAGKTHLIACSPEAREVFRQFHNESVALRRGDFRDIEAELGRWRENAIRIAVGQCVADDPKTQMLTGEQAARAVEIMRWCARSALQITNVARMKKRAHRADELQAIVATKAGGRETLRLLEKSHGFNQEEVKTLAGEFPERFIIEHLQTGGRPSDILRLATIIR